MYELEFITKEQHDAAVAEEPAFVHTEAENTTSTVYSYYAETVIDDVIRALMADRSISRDTARQLLYQGGYQVYSCFDAQIQAIVDSYYTDLSKLPVGTSASGQQFESAIVILDPYTGEIPALCGGTGSA